MTVCCLKNDLEKESSVKFLNSEEKYNSLKSRLAYYLLLQVYTFLQTSGMKDLPEAMKRLVGKAAEINVKRAKHYPKEKHPEFVGSELARHMGETFSSDYHIEKGDGKFKVVLDRCGCIGSVLERSKDFELDESVSRAIFCGACIGGYRKTADDLNMKFDGELTDKGCYMNFQTQ